MTQPTPPKKKSFGDGLESIILAGGLGTRLRSVISDRQKVIAPINGSPTLEIIIKRLFNQGVKRVILCVGYLKETVMESIRKAALEDPRFSKVEFSEEETPLGTGGAIKLAAKNLRGEECLIVNGDTLVDFEVAQLSSFHKNQNNDISIVVTKETEGDGGRIDIDDSKRILSFHEKSGAGKFVNAGAYILNRKALEKMPEGVFSIESEFFPDAIKTLNCGAFTTKGFIDIGTPERYELANKTFLPRSDAGSQN